MKREGGGGSPPSRGGKILLPTPNKTPLAILALVVNASINMKRIFTLIVLLGIVAGTVLTGCEQKPADNSPAGTNAPAAAAAASTNK